ncbi:translocation/assembly module TamB domain-containing protein [Blattabacterium cuenoti]|uniref:translocation/assembly module TamB domain-containing protein n=1 Tax=Blattabacterium cuenoti TaxID=1653831 RepID=UPI00163BA011|nr:translocation/assembly module TamB domain-containing protein [Blattabacterium cuenoti]
MNNVFLYQFFTKKKIILFFLLFLCVFIYFINIYDQKIIQKKVSTFLLQKVKKKFGNKIYIKHISFNLLKKELILYDVKIKDHHYFPFIHLYKCKIYINNLFFLIFINYKYLSIQSIVIENSSFFVKKYFKEKENNIFYFIKNFLNNKKFNKIKIITCSKLKINKSHFRYINSKKEFNYFFSSYIKNIIIKKKKIKASILSFQSKIFINKKKFFIKNFFCNLIYFYPKRLEIHNFFIKTSNSFLKGIFYIDILQKNIKCKIFKGSKLGYDLGGFFYKKWFLNLKLFFQGNINGKFHGINNKFFLSNIFIKYSQKNKFFAKKIHVYLFNNKCKKIKFFKTFIQFYPHKIIPYNFYSQLNFKKVNSNFKPWIYKGNLTIIIKKKISLKIEGIIQKNFLIAKISTYINFLNHNIQYIGKILIEKKYILKILLNKNKKNFFFIPSKIPLFTNKYSFYKLWILLKIKENLSKIFINLFSSHSEDYKINFQGKINLQYQKIDIIINNNKNNKKNQINKKIKIILINNKKFKKININIYDIIIGNINGYFKWKDLFHIMKKEIFYLKKSYKKRGFFSINYNFIIKKYFYKFIKYKKNIKIFSDIIISGKKNNDKFENIFFIKKIQSNKIIFHKLFIIVDSSLKKKIQIHAEKIIYKNFFCKKINIFFLKNQGNFWIINLKFLFKLKEQEYKKQILNFFCKKEKNFFLFLPLYSKLNINGYNWNINIDNNNLGKIKIDFIKKIYIIHNIIFLSEKQKIIINAFFIKNKTKIFHFYFKNIKLQKIINNTDGLVNGFFLCQSDYNYNKIKPNIHIQITNFSIKKIFLGNFYIHSFYNKNIKNYNINGYLKKNNQDILKIYGNINNKYTNQSKIDFNIDIINFRIDNFSFFYKKINSEIRGFLTGKIRIFGNIKDPHYCGRIKIKKFGIKINSINIDYEIINNAYINIYSKYCILLSSSFFKDTKYNTKGYINGYFLHKNFIKWDFKFFINTKNLLVLDTNEKQNRFLFGKILINGKIQIIKKENKVNVLMKNGEILNSSHLYINPNYKKKHKSIPNKNYKIEEKNYLLIDINLKINIKKNTKVSIFLNKNLENFFELKGEGYLFLRKKYKKNIETNGKYFIIDGLYHFSKKEKIPIIKLEKKFKIKPGGFISWKKNFNQSNINLIAYENKYIFNINDYIHLKKFSENNKNMIFTELIIHIYGKINKLNIKMDILFPKSNEKIQQKLLNKLNSFEEKTIQFIYILILGKFFVKNNIINNFFYFSIFKIFFKKLKKILLYSYIYEPINKPIKY